MDKELGNIITKVKALGYTETQVVSAKKYFVHKSGNQVKLDAESKLLSTLDNRGYIKEQVSFSTLNDNKIKKLCEVF
jgi:hypothetical protein